MNTKMIFATIAITGLLAIAQQPARLANLSFSNLVLNLNLSHQNALSHQQRLNHLQLAITARAVRGIASPFRFARPHSAVAP